MTQPPGALPTFLDPPRPVELAARVEGVAPRASSAELTVATERYAPALRPYYGTEAETVTAAPVSGRAAVLRVEVADPGILRVRYAPGTTVPAGVTPMLAGGLAGGELAVQEDEAGLRLRGPGIGLDVACDPLALTLRGATGRAVWATRPLRLHTLEADSTLEWSWLFYHRYAYPLGVAAEGRPAAFCSFEVAHDERLHGLGEGFGPLDKRFQRHALWPREAFSNATEGTYKPIPFWLSTRGYGVFVNTANELTVDLGAREHTAGAVTVGDTDALDLWLVVGGTPGAVLERYTAITGRPRVPPRWSFGLWMGRISYASEAEVDRVSVELREQRVPCDVVHVDTNWFARDWHCDWRFSPDRFPDPAALLARLRGRGFRVSLWQWPLLLEGSEVYAEAVAAGHVARAAGEEPALVDGPEGRAAFIDLTSPAAVAWYQGKLRALLDLGVGAIKADFGEGAPADACWAGAPGAAMRALYPLLYNRAVFEAGETGVIWARSAWAGSQRYPLHWSGDGVARFADLPCVLRSALSFGLSGFPFYSHDIGGFAGNPTPELYVRWAQLGLLSSHARAHGRPPREPWAYGERAAAITRRYTELRSRLMPYLYAEALRCGEDSTPLVRALLIDFPDDPVAGLVDDEYLLGRALLVAPVLDASESRRVYLPRGGWVDFWTKAVLEGGRHLEVAAPLDTVPLYVRAGAVLPLGPVRQHTEEEVAEGLTVELYAPEGRGRFALSDGEELAYEVEDGRVRVRAPQEADVVVHGSGHEVVR